MPMTETGRPAGTSPNKPPGLVVHPGAGNETGTLVNALIAHCGDSLSGIGGVRRPGIVHRGRSDETLGPAQQGRMASEDESVL